MINHAKRETKEVCLSVWHWVKCWKKNSYENIDLQSMVPKFSREEFYLKSQIGSASRRLAKGKADLGSTCLMPD